MSIQTIKDLYSTSNINPKIRSTMTTIIGNELSKLSQPCYFPAYEKYTNGIRQQLGLNDSDVKEFIKGFYPKRLSNDYILKDVDNNVLLFMMWYFLSVKDHASYLTTLIYLSIKFYASRFQVHFKKVGCNPDIFKSALDNLNVSHLFIQQKGISGFIFYIAKAVDERFRKDLEKFDDPDRISRFVYELRHRIAQSVRSFANLYFYYLEKGASIKTQKEYEDQTEFESSDVAAKTGRKAEEVVQRMTTYKQINQHALDSAKNISQLPHQLNALDLVTILSDNIYSDDIKQLLYEYLKTLKKVDDVCGNAFLKNVEKLVFPRSNAKDTSFRDETIKLTNIILKKHSPVRLTNDQKNNVYYFIAL